MLLRVLPDVHMSLWGEIDLAAQDPLPPITPWQLTHLAALQVPVTLLDLGVAIVQRNVPHNLKHLHCLNDLQAEPHIGMELVWNWYGTICCQEDDIKILNLSFFQYRKLLYI